MSRSSAFLPKRITALQRRVHVQIGIAGVELEHVARA